MTNNSIANIYEHVMIITDLPIHIVDEKLKASRKERRAVKDTLEEETDKLSQLFQTINTGNAGLNDTKHLRLGDKCVVECQSFVLLAWQTLRDYFLAHLRAEVSQGELL